MKKMLYVAFIVAALAGMTNANIQAAVAKRGGVCIDPLCGGDSVLQYERIGRVMIKQIYGKNFHVAHIQGDKSTATYMMLVIEKQ